MFRQSLEFYQSKVQGADVETLKLIVDTAVKMDAKTKQIFRAAITHGDLEILRERLAGWLHKNQEV